MENILFDEDFATILIVLILTILLFIILLLGTCLIFFAPIYLIGGWRHKDKKAQRIGIILALISAFSFMILLKVYS